MGPVQIFRMLKARWPLIIAVAIAGAIVGAIAAKQIPSRYEARSRVVVDLLKADPVTGEALPPRTLETYLAAQVELIRDPRVTRRVVEHFGWEQSAALRARYDAAAPAPRISMRDWLAEDVSQRTRATLIRNSPILEIAYGSTVPETARRGADAVRDAFLAEALDSKRRDAAQKAAWFGRQAATLKGRLAEAEQRKAAFERANNIVLQDDNMDAESSKLRALASSAPPPAAAAVGGTPFVAPSAGALAQTSAQLAAARREMGVNHPQIIALQQQQAALSAAVSREEGAARAAARSVAGGGAATIGIDAQTRKVLAQRGLVDEARRLAGDVAVLRDQVTKTMQRAAEFELQAQSTEAGFSKLGAAALPRTATTPGRWLLIIGGLLAGAGLGAAAALLIEFVSRRVRGAEDLSLGGLPFVVSLDAGARGGGARRDWRGANLGQRVAA